MAKHIHDQAILHYKVYLSESIKFLEFCDNAYEKARSNELFFGAKGSQDRRYAQTRLRDLNPKFLDKSFKFEVSFLSIVA